MPDNPQNDDLSFDDIARMESELSRMKESIDSSRESTVRELREIAEHYKKIFQTLQESFETLIASIPERFREKTRNEWDRFFSEVGSAGGRILGDILSRSIQLGLQNSLTGSIQTTFDRLAGPLAGVVTAGLAAAIGSVTGGVGAAAAGVLLPAVQQVISPIASYAGMHFEGYRMAGARVAQIIDPGFLRGWLENGATLRDFGKFFASEMMRLRVATGATEEEVAQTARAFSLLGIGLADGGSDLTEFSLALEKTMNLNQGVMAQLQTDIVRRYGQDVNSIIPVMNIVASTTKEMTAAYRDQENAVAGAFRSSQLVIEAFGQITAQARTSQQSIEGLTAAAQLLLRTAVSPPSGRSMFRAEEAVRTAGTVLGGLMARPQPTMEAEAPMAGVAMLIMQQTPFGQEVLQRELEETRRLRLPPTSLETVSAQLNVRDPQHGLRRLLAMIMGLEAQRERTGEYSVQMLLEQRGVDQASSLLVRQLMELVRREGVLGAQDPFARFQQLLSSPENKNISDDIRKYIEQAKNIGENSMSILDTVARNLQAVSEYFRDSYFTDSRNAVREAFGLEKVNMPAGGMPMTTPSATPGFGPGTGVSPLEKPPGMLAMEEEFLRNPWGGNPPTGGAANPLTPRREVTLITPHTQASMVHQEVATKGGLMPTGSR